MSLDEQIQDWSQLTLKHVFYAYRKAKADCFFERTVNCAGNFVDFERDLANNLAVICDSLRRGEIDRLFYESLGENCLIAKRLAIIPKRRNDKQSEGHDFFSDPVRAFKSLCATHDLEPQFRIVGDFPVTMHVLSALWINLVGHKYDAALSRDCYGSRLRRYRPTTGRPVGEYHIEAVGSFEPYFEPYKRWRAKGLTAIRSELEADREVIALSLDIANYYHRIDPTFLGDPRFLSAAGVTLSAWETQFTTALISALQSWSQRVSQEIHAMGGALAEGGLPIGLSAARIIANVLLVELDREIERELTPVYFGRYMDDILLVIRDPGHLSSARDVLSFIGTRVKRFPYVVGGADLRLTLGDYQQRSDLVLQRAKQKTFFLRGQGGIDLLDHIESEMRSVSSERRLMPSPSALERMASAQILTATASSADETDTIRKADGLAVRRLGWSIQLRAVEILARDIPGEDWREERLRFYEFAHSHILRADKILDQIDYLPRLLSLAVTLSDWSEAQRLLDGSLMALKILGDQTADASITVNGVAISQLNTQIWERLKATVLASAGEAVMAAIPWARDTGAPVRLAPPAWKLCQTTLPSLSEAEIYERALAIREADWAKVAYKDHLRWDTSRRRPSILNEVALYGLYKHEGVLRTFLFETSKTRGDRVSRVNLRCAAETAEGTGSSSLIPFICPSRAYTAQEISLFEPACVFGIAPEPARLWAEYTRAVRGVWVWPAIDGGAVPPPVLPWNGGPSNGDRGNGWSLADLSGEASYAPVRLGISSLLTTTASWRAAASGSSDTSPARYERIRTIVNQAISSKPKPTHLLLPELSIPDRWIRTISELLHASNINLIAGLDYRLGGNNSIHSDAVLVLIDDRLGFPASVQIRQPKSLPAPKEEEDLLLLFGRSWSEIEPTKPIYIHGGFCFGVLVCSELQNIEHRSHFQGYVDCVVILSWNQDLETFSALVESASLDVHAPIALVNNRAYGDSRVRAPAKQHHRRDLCRLRGGENEHLVVVELDVATLRAFQSRARRWPSDADPFKPVPEGFKIWQQRRTTPK
ncbi:hypothetical protein GGD63_002717 [Bradyrhizobium sp. cir1]|uniref:RNA-directed DNA polymerase n=1 Tax=Bradyrhizobium sp. cir1 TaxID=1445730 RepID=UPI001606B73C|nr:RNA-directed DNA polymerase [Bradyrhizobium sp. cir1]MBB4369924.1 hypothetical protein [Bradyrhizobium sp. cir1]